MLESQNENRIFLFSSDPIEFKLNVGVGFRYMDKIMHFTLCWHVFRADNGHLCQR